MEEDYVEFVKSQIELDKLLSVIKPEYHEQIKELLKKKKEIMKNNGFFADFQLNKINKKINKIKNIGHI
ncbi:MAG: hypothetical protein HFJ45_03755 [Clostridia bacterium]|nr:hypothetical protein [Clostridia bacterium]